MTCVFGRGRTERGTDSAGGGRVRGRRLAAVRMRLNEEHSICRRCGQPHRMVSLRAGERAHCVRCGVLLARVDNKKNDVAKAFALAALCLAFPASFLPVVTLSKLGDTRSSYLISGVDALWEQGSSALAGWVLICAIAAPLCLLIIIGMLSFAGTGFVPETALRPLHALGYRIQRWSMPEVHVLAVFVAFFKLGDLVDVTIEPGLWCYGGASVALLVSWQSFKLAPDSPGLDAGKETS